MMESTTLPDLMTCLQGASWRHLLAMMECHGLPASARWRKPELIQTFHSHLLQPQTLTTIVPQLPAAVHHALSALFTVGGALPAHTFQKTFGKLQPYRPWRQQEAQEERPWTAPASPAAHLWWLGLLYLDPPRPRPGTLQRVVLPSDLLPHLQPLLARTAEQSHQLLPRPSLPPDLSWQMAVWLATLASDPITLLRGGWLPPTTLTHLAQRLGLDQAADFRPTRSERRQPYLAFLHSLALTAELITTGATHALTPLAWQWLSAPPAERWQQLWRAWLTADIAATHAFPFPWSVLTPAAREQALVQVRRLSFTHFTPLADLVQQTHLHDRYGHLAQPITSDQDLVADLCLGPFFWFGLLDLATTTSPPITVTPPEIEDEDDHATPPTRHPPLATLLVRLTPHGAWLLAEAGWGPPTFATAVPCTMAPHTSDRLLISPQVQPSHLARLAPYCTWSPPQFPALTQQLQLTPERVGAAAAAGESAAQIFHTLEAALGQSPSRRLRQRLRTWVEAGQQVQLQPMLVLTTADAPLMGRLRSRKLVRRHLETVLSPTRSAVHAGTVAALVQTLRTLDIYTAIPPAYSPPATDQIIDQPKGQTPSTADAGLLWMLVKVYQGLGAHVDLPVTLPTSLLGAIGAQLSPAQQAAATSAAQQVLDSIKRTLHGYLRLPAWHLLEQRSDVLPTLEKALAQRHDLTISYWSGGRDEKSIRRVTPYYLETRSGLLYLIAYCHLRDDERVFRVDRIESATPSPESSSPQSTVS